MKQINFWPRRILFIDDSVSGTLTLIENQSLDRDYLVLSHCWGNPTDDEKALFCTTTKNHKKRLGGFSWDELPKTFQDAVEITRALGKQYLWIDALCIIQGDGGDWESQANTMQDIFANAYCTIAATSADSWKDGFLKPRSGSLDGQTQNNFTSSACQCDFDKDVDAGPLMQRAWVLQERVLSRRTIHFTKFHVYCECGGGVICEQVTKLNPPFGKQYFILDPQFPDRLYSSGYERTIQFIQFLFQKYSVSGLTVETDRNIAIDGLITRISQVLKSPTYHGIFHQFVSLLLWKRTRENGPPIQYTDQVPSWSWMAYSGGIDFILQPTSQFLVPRRNDLDFADDGRALNVKVSNFGEGCRAGKNEANYVILNGMEEVGYLWFDMVDQIQLKDCKCVVVGTLKDEEDARRDYYILVIRNRYGGINGDKDGREDGNQVGGKRYERVGVGKVKARIVSIDCTSGTLW